jgi:hypothetical protein
MFSVTPNKTKRGYIYIRADIFSGERKCLRNLENLNVVSFIKYRVADKSLARPGMKQVAKPAEMSNTSRS